jgi:hypothetical protein
MQNTVTFRTVTRGAVQTVVLAAVAVIGVSVGHWVIPAEDSSGTTAVRYIEATAPAVSPDILERKLAQLDARDARYTAPVTASAPTGKDSIIDRKLAQMDAQDAWHATAVAAAASAPFIPGSDRIIDRKLAQMDALDGRVTRLVADRDDSIIERKFAQMDAQDAR